jgi:sulfatase maturation enzyme AslB (radical SAM superfamily)
MTGKRNNINIVNITDEQESNILNTESIERLTLITTKGCNLECDYCFEKHYPEQKMDINIALDRIEKYQPEVIKFFGGEPLIHRGFLRTIMDKYPDKRYEMTTNGTYLKKLELQYLNMFESINVSLDGIYERDSTRWHKKEEYDEVLSNIMLLKSYVTGDVIVNITTGAHGFDYHLVDRMFDINQATGVDCFDINIVVMDADGNIVLDKDGRQEFIRQCYQAYAFSLHNDGAFRITLNEAVFATDDATCVGCAWKTKSQAAIDVNGYESHCHVAAYYNIPDKELLHMEEITNAACVTLQAVAERASVHIDLDKENFSALSKAEMMNNEMYRETKTRRTVQSQE